MISRHPVPVGVDRYAPQPPERLQGGRPARTSR